MPVRRRPSDDLGAHLEFALKREGVDLSVLDALFRSIDAGQVAEIVESTPTGKYARRIWFLYEWLTGRKLDLPDAPKVRAGQSAKPVRWSCPLRSWSGFNVWWSVTPVS